MNRPVVLYICVLFTAFLSLLGGCAGTPVVPVLPVKEAEPEWLSTPPSDEQWYYGIGGAHTNDEVADREKAMMRARADLAASISVDIVSVLESEVKQSSDGSTSEALEQRVTQSVEQSLVNIQTVEGWYGTDKGYWVLIRMNRDEWSAQRKSDRRAAVTAPVGLEDQGGFNMSFLTELGRKDLSLQLLPGGKNTPYEITLDWVVSDYPVLDETGGIFFSSLRGVIGFYHYGLLIDSFEYGPVKGGGLNYEQARERAAFKVFERFREDELFGPRIEGYLDRS